MLSFFKIYIFLIRNLDVKRRVMNISNVLCLYHRIENWFLEAKWFTCVLLYLFYFHAHTYTSCNSLCLSLDIFSNALYRIVINNIFLCGNEDEEIDKSECLCGTS